MLMALLLFCQVDSLSLAEAIEIGMARSPAYLESRASLGKARIDFYRSLSYLLPTVTTTGTYTRTRVSGIEDDRYVGSLSLAVPIFDLDVISAIVVAGAQMSSAEIGRQESAASLVLRIKSAYVGLVGARELERAAESAITRAEENQRLVQTKFELGSASRLEVLQAEVFMLRARQDRAKARTQYETAQQELQALLDLSRTVVPTDTLVEPAIVELPPLDTLRVVLERANYAVLLANKAQSVAKANLILTSAAFLPRVSFFWGYTSTTDSLIFDFQYHRENAVRNYGINVSVPLLEIQQLVFDWLAARKDKEVQDYRSRRAVLEAEKSLVVAYLGLQESEERLRFARASQQASREAGALAREQYNLGIISLLDLLGVEEDYYNARVVYIQALSDHYVQEANFTYLLAGAAISGGEGER